MSKQILLIFSLIRTALLSRILNLKNGKHLKKISEKLMPIMWHPRRWWNFWISEDEDKDIELILLRGCTNVCW